MTAKYEVLKLWLKYISGCVVEDYKAGVFHLVISLLIISSQVYLAWEYKNYYRQLFIAGPAS